MTGKPMRVGLIGCGNISEAYLRQDRPFRDFTFVACADAVHDAASRRAREFGLKALEVDQLLASDDIDIVLNLTIPSAHAEVSIAALQAGKHVYTEKPLATSIRDAERIVETANSLGLTVGSAPDTVLGPAIQLGKAMIARGDLGRVITGTAATLNRGMEHWHPNPATFYKPGGGPMLDIGPYYVAGLTTLLGPVRRVTATGSIGSAERAVTAEGPRQGELLKVEVLTTVNALLTFQSGAEVVLMTSWDVWRHGQFPIELHGTAASMRVPDPNWFGGDIEISEIGGAWTSLSTDGATFGRRNFVWDGVRHANYRGIGLADMARGIVAGEPPRCSGRFALHGLRVMLGILESAIENRGVEIVDDFDSPAALSEADAGSLLVSPRG